MPARTRSAPPPETAPEQAEAEAGFFRNTGGLALTVLGPDTRVIEPGRIAPLATNPGHRDLAPASESDYAAQQAADTAAAATESIDDAEPAAAESPEKTEA